jgi:2-C-methyl-D-erythritol 4-phosphate cytidylyltransferase
VKVAAIVPAAGRGERLGPGAPKALRLLGGVPMLVHAVRALARARLVDVVVVAAPPGDEASVRGLLDTYEVAREVSVTTGGATRQDSVRLALESLPADVDVVLVHDAARPLAPSELVDEVVQAVARGGEAVIPAMPVADTIKRVGPDGRVLETLRRDELYAVQTPQGFSRELLTKAHEAAVIDTFAGTDDASLVERLGRTVLVVPGHPDAAKVTRPGDLAAAEARLAQRLARREH